jgi:hypothetical protein
MSYHPGKFDFPKVIVDHIHKSYGREVCENFLKGDGFLLTNSKVYTKVVQYEPQVVVELFSQLAYAQHIISKKSYRKSEAAPLRVLDGIGIMLGSKDFHRTCQMQDAS